MGHSDTKYILFIFGTRPEAIKLCPLITTLRASQSPLKVVVCVTGQHREMLHQVLQAFAIQPDFDLALMTENQSLNALSTGLLSGLERVFQNVLPALTIVQGDTTTALCGALASFHRRVPVAHVEAGLRTYDLSSPFPEEGNRVLIDRLADLHFAATQSAADNLLQEGSSLAGISVTGNTGIDAILSIAGALERGELKPSITIDDPGKRLLLVTAHRRESFGSAFDEICSAIAELARRRDVHIAWPVHPNPNVQAAVHSQLQGMANVTLLPPLDYPSFVQAMRSSYLILTDSGGIQEEAPSLGKPVLVLREKTERLEGVRSGSVKLVGTTCADILQATNLLLDTPAEYARMAGASNIYGDGHASPRIAARIETFLFSGGKELP